MSIQVISTFNPLLSSGGTIVNTLSGTDGATWIVYNDSPVTILLAWNGNQKTIPAGVCDLVVFSGHTGTVTWTKVATLANYNLAPISLVTIDGFDGKADGQKRYPFFLPARVLAS